jgi:hypothetical protein
MTNSKYAAFVALDPFFNVVMQGLDGAVDGERYFDAVGDSTILHSGNALIVHRSHEPGVLILEYEVHGKRSEPEGRMTIGSSRS